MQKRNLTRRDFIGKTTAGVATAAFSTGISTVGLSSCKADNSRDRNSRKYSEGDFAHLVDQSLPTEELYDYHKRLSLLAATRDSQLGFQFEQDYVYTPYSLALNFYKLVL